MNDTDIIQNTLDPFTQPEKDKVDTDAVINAIKIRDNNDFSKRIRFDKEVSKKLTLMMTYWDIDHSAIVAKAIHELYANKFLSELNELNT